MVFVSVMENRPRLESLTKLLIRTFPGSVIYQYSDPMFAAVNMPEQDVDAVLTDLPGAEHWHLVERLRKNRPELPVLLLLDNGQPQETALKHGAGACRTFPLIEQKLREAVCAGCVPAGRTMPCPMIAENLCSFDPAEK